MRWLSRLSDHVVEQPPTLSRNVRGSLDGAAQTAELANEIFERRFDFPADSASAIRKEEEAGQSAQEGPE